MSILDSIESTATVRRDKWGRWKAMSRADRIKEIRKAMGLTLQEMADLFVDPPITRAGVGHWEKGGGISDKHLTQLVHVSGYRRSWITDGELPKKRAADTNELSPNAIPTNIEAHVTGHRDLPILGAVQGGADGVFIDNGTHFGMIARPMSLVGVSSAYAVEVYDESMYPRFEPGEILPVNPHKAVRKGDDCVVQVPPSEPGGDIRYFVKRFVRRNENAVVVKQFNPEIEIEYPANSIVHKIPPRGH